MNVLIIGHKDHGKSDVGHLLAEFLDTRAHDSSWFSAEHVVYPVLKERYGYTSVEKCYEDRGNHREEWFTLIRDFNAVPDRLTLAILDQGSIYIGMRSRYEFEGSKHHFDYIIWVDASKRKPEESPASMQLTVDDADHVLDNNGTLDDLDAKVRELAMWLSSQ